MRLVAPVCGKWVQLVAFPSLKPFWINSTQSRRRYVGPIGPDYCVMCKISWPSLESFSRNFIPEAVGSGIFDGFFFTIPSDWKQLMTLYPMWLNSALKCLRIVLKTTTHGTLKYYTYFMDVRVKFGDSIVWSLSRYSNHSVCDGQRTTADEPWSN